MKRKKRQRYDLITFQSGFGNQSLVRMGLITVHIEALSSLLKVPRRLRYIILSRLEGLQFYIMSEIFLHIIFQMIFLPTMYFNNNVLKIEYNY